MKVRKKGPRPKKEAQKSREKAVEPQKTVEQVRGEASARLFEVFDDLNKRLNLKD